MSKLILKKLSWLSKSKHEEHHLYEKERIFKKELNPEVLFETSEKEEAYFERDWMILWEQDLSEQQSETFKADSESFEDISSGRSCSSDTRLLFSSSRDTTLAVGNSSISLRWMLTMLVSIRKERHE